MAETPTDPWEEAMNAREAALLVQPPGATDPQPTETDPVADNQDPNSHLPVGGEVPPGEPFPVAGGAGGDDADRNVEEEDLERKKAGKTARRACYYYHRLYRHTREVLVGGLDQGANVSVYFFERLSPEELEHAHRRLEQLCHQHAPPLSVEQKGAALRAARRVGNVSNKDTFEKLSPEQQQFVQDVLALEGDDDQKKKDQSRLIGDKTVTFIEDFITATGGRRKSASPHAFLEEIARQEQGQEDGGATGAAEVADNGNPASETKQGGTVSPPQKNQALIDQFRDLPADVARRQQEQQEREQAQRSERAAVKADREELDRLRREVRDLRRDKEALEQRPTADRLREVEAERDARPTVDRLQEVERERDERPTRAQLQAVEEERDARVTTEQLQLTTRRHRYWRWGCYAAIAIAFIAAGIAIERHYRYTVAQSVIQDWVDYVSK